MPRIEPVDPDNVSKEVAQLLEQAKQPTGGRLLNVHREIANSPAVLRGYLGLRDALAEGELSPELHEEIYIAVADANG